MRAFVYVQEESFAMDVYTEICIQAAGAKELTAFTSEYEDTVAKAKENIEKIKEQRQKARYTEIVDEANGKIAEAEAEVPDAQTKLENGKAEAAAKLADAKAEVAELEKPKWYIYDRNDLPDYSGYGDNADRMKAIGEVFPVIFFLVAALISLTTMTRMVEEQRTQIGTLKALGYARHSIAGKYLGYAFLATLLGSAAGIFTGEKIFPYIIINAYGICINT